MDDRRATAKEEAKFALDIDSDGQVNVYSLAIFIGNVRAKFLVDPIQPANSWIVTGYEPEYKRRLTAVASTLRVSVPTVNAYIRSEDGDLMAATLLLVESLKAQEEIDQQMAETVHA
ncbi:hypothetical protein CcrC1_gp411 [Caulobacter phage C1]|nr:hypothetical protein CcrC1_gp411 [Caulobacter phage C1]WGN97825.1 hypothetical protein [Bertelyvirus sp.]